MYTFPRNLNIDINFFDSDLAWNWNIFKSPSWTMIFFRRLVQTLWEITFKMLHLSAAAIVCRLESFYGTSVAHRCLCEDCRPDECAVRRRQRSVGEFFPCDAATAATGRQRPRLCILQNKCLLLFVLLRLSAASSMMKYSQWRASLHLVPAASPFSHSLVSFIRGGVTRLLMLLVNCVMKTCIWNTFCSFFNSVNLWLV